MGTKAGSGNNLDTNLPLFLKNQRKMKAVLFVLLVVTMATIIHGMAVSFDDAFRRSKLYFRCMRDCNTDRSECKTECLNKPENFSGCRHSQELQTRTSQSKGLPPALAHGSVDAIRATTT